MIRVSGRRLAPNIGSVSPRVGIGLRSRENAAVLGASRAAGGCLQIIILRSVPSARLTTMKLSLTPASAGVPAPRDRPQIDDRCSSAWKIAWPPRRVSRQPLSWTVTSPVTASTRPGMKFGSISARIAGYWNLTSLRSTPLQESVRPPSPAPQPCLILTAPRVWWSRIFTLTPGTAAFLSTTLLVTDARAFGGRLEVASLGEFSVPINVSAIQPLIGTTDYLGIEAQKSVVESSG